MFKLKDTDEFLKSWYVIYEQEYLIRKKMEMWTGWQVFHMALVVLVKEEGKRSW